MNPTPPLTRFLLGKKTDSQWDSIRSQIDGKAAVLRTFCYDLPTYSHDPGSYTIPPLSWRLTGVLSLRLSCEVIYHDKYEDLKLGRFVAQG